MLAKRHINEYSRIRGKKEGEGCKVNRILGEYKKNINLQESSNTLIFILYWDQSNSHNTFSIIFLFLAFSTIPFYTIFYSIKELLMFNLPKTEKNFYGNQKSDLCFSYPYRTFYHFLNILLA